MASDWAPAGGPARTAAADVNAAGIGTGTGIDAPGTPAGTAAPADPPPTQPRPEATARLGLGSPRETGTGHTGLGHTGLGHTGLGHTGLGQAGLGHTGLGRLGSGTLGSGRLGQARGRMEQAQRVRQGVQAQWTCQMEQARGQMEQAREWSCTPGRPQQHFLSLTAVLMPPLLAWSSSTSKTSRRALAEAGRALVPGGTFLLFMNHPLLQAPGSGWVDDDILGEQYWRIGPYLAENHGVEEVDKNIWIPFIHRPLSVYVNALVRAGLYITAMLEPPPPEGFLQKAAEYRRADAFPRLMVLRAEKLPNVPGPTLIGRPALAQ